MEMCLFFTPDPHTHARTDTHFPPLVYFAEVLFRTGSTLAALDCEMSGGKQCPNAPNATIDARAIRKFSGMLKRMQMHTMP